MFNKYLTLVFVAGFVIIVDQLTKMYVHTHFHLGESLPVLTDYFSFTYVRNTGAAFGIFRESNELFRTIFFLSVPPIAVTIIIFIMRSLPSSEKMQILALSWIFGGALGNYIDRVRFRYVIDFLEIHYKDVYSWPAFNIADSAIVGGVGILLVIMVKQAIEEAKQKKLASTKG